MFNLRYTMKFFGRKKEKEISGLKHQAGDYNKIAKDDRDEVELACRDLMLASLENMRKEIIPGKRDSVEPDDLDKEYQEIADFINKKVNELEAEIPEKISAEGFEEPDIAEESDNEAQDVLDEISESVEEKVLHMEPIEQEFSISPNKQMIIDQITAFDIESAVLLKGMQSNS